MTKRTMKCKQCGDTFPGYKALFDHQRDEHSSGPHAKRAQLARRIRAVSPAINLKRDKLVELVYAELDLVRQLRTLLAME